MAEILVHEVTDKNWEEIVEKGKEPVFAMFYSPTCTHCVRMQPYVDELAGEYSRQITFVRLNIIRYGWLAERYGVMATPTFMFFCGGRPVQTRVGAVYPAMLKKMVKEMTEHGEECRLKSTEISYEISGYG